MIELTRARLYDTMKFDALHNRQFLEWVFTPSRALLEEEFGIIIGGNGNGKDSSKPAASNGDEQQQTSSSGKTSEESKRGDGKNGAKDTEKDEPRKRKLFRRTSWKNSLRGGTNKMAPPEEYFNLCKGDSQTKTKTDARFEPLRELYQLAKVLFDFICPQEYGISDSEKVITPAHLFLKAADTNDLRSLRSAFSLPSLFFARLCPAWRRCKLPTKPSASSTSPRSRTSTPCSTVFWRAASRPRSSAARFPSWTISARSASSYTSPRRIRQKPRPAASTPHSNTAFASLSALAAMSTTPWTCSSIASTASAARRDVA